MNSSSSSKTPKIYTMSVARVYPLYVQKVERKGRTQAELDEVIAWLTGYRGESLQRVLQDGVTFEEFFANAPALNAARNTITGVICGVRVEKIEQSLMREIRYLDKIVDELARGWSLEKIFRVQA